MNRLNLKVSNQSMGLGHHVFGPMFGSTILTPLELVLTVVDFVNTIQDKGIFQSNSNVMANKNWFDEKTFAYPELKEWYQLQRAQRCRRI